MFHDVPFHISCVLCRISSPKDCEVYASNTQVNGESTDGTKRLTNIVLTLILFGKAGRKWLLFQLHLAGSLSSLFCCLFPFLRRNRGSSSRSLGLHLLRMLI